jgi:hypothetical protein
LLCPAGDFRGGKTTPGGAPGDISVAFDQFPAPNDNSYGANAVGWPGGHLFKDLTNSDKAGFQILRPNNTVAVSFNVDYLVQNSAGSPPSGFRSGGPFGGDGSILINSTPPLTSDGTTIQWDTSFSRDLNGVQSPFGTWSAPTYFMGGAQTFCTAGTNSTNLLQNSPPVDCSLATDPNCIINYGPPKGIQYPLAVPNCWTKSYDNPEYSNAGGPIPLGAFDAGHVDGWNFHDTYFVTFKQAYLTAIGFDFSNFAIATYDSTTNTFTCPSGEWCIAPNPTALHNSPAKPCPSPSGTPSPTPTPTPCVCALSVTARTVSAKNVTITIRNDGCANEVITNIALSWPQGTNGNLVKIKRDGDTLWNPPGGAASPINFGVPPLTNDATKRTIQKGTSDQLIFQFTNNAAPLNNPAYSGSATFQSGCVLGFGLPTP